MYHVWGKGEVHRGLWRGEVREGDHLEDPRVDGRIIFKWIFKEWDGARIGMVWLRIWRGSRLL